MGYVSAVGFLALTLCVVVCLAESVDDVNSEQTAAQQAVGDAQNAIKDVYDKAENNLNNAKLVLGNVEGVKEQAEGVKFQAIKVATGYESAKATLVNIENFCDTVSTLHQNAKLKLQNTISSLEQVLLDAAKLKTECDKEVMVVGASIDKYKAIKNNAKSVKEQAKVLEKTITDACTIIPGVQSTAGDMEKNLKNAQLANVHVSGIVAVTKIETKIKEADGIIQETQNKRNLVNGIVEEMQKHCTTELIGSNKIIEMQCKSATDELKKATSAVENATKAKAEMTEQKDSANAALAKVNTEITVENAKNEVDTTQACATAIENIIAKLNNALKSADLSLTNANALKKNLETALSTTTTKPSTKEVKETEVANPQVEDGTDSHQKDTTEKPKSKDSLDHKDNSAAILKDTLSNGVQNGTTAPLIGKNVPASGAKNDSAMTVSVPLLVALIASAVLQ